MRSNGSSLTASLVVILSTAIRCDAVHAVDGPAEVTDEATYDLVFESTWGPETHPRDIPSNPHFSGLVGGTHNDGVSFWRHGGLATPGIRSMAEFGSKGTLLGEVRAAIAAGTAEHEICGGGIGRSPGSVSLQVFASLDHPLATIVCMVAPSPDWFVGVSGLSLLDAEGAWHDSLAVELHVYDAGTDSGVSYRSPNQATTPQEPIGRLTSGPPAEGVPFGRFIFTRFVDQPGSGPFLRGDANSDRTIDLSDCVFILNYLFTGGPEPECLDAADASAVGEINLTTAVFLLNHLFLSLAPPPPPHPDCGFVSSDQEILGCRDSPCEV